MAVNKVIYGDTTLIDLTSDTVAADKILEGYTAHDKSGTFITGTYSSKNATLTVTYSEDFYGVTITATNGSKTLTAVATSSGSVEFKLPEDGTWTVSATVEGQLYEESVLVDTYYNTELSALPNGSTATPVNVIQTWLRCAQIKDKNYTTLSQVLNDTATLEALVSDSNACDYMVRSTNWASGIAADANAMALIGKFDYCANKLLSNATWAEAIANSTYFESVLNVKVPVMTSNTTPEGEASSNDAYVGYEAYKAFDRNDSGNGWGPVGTILNRYVQYSFISPIKVSKIGLYFKDSTGHTNTIMLSGSNDGTNFTPIKDDISLASGAWYYFSTPNNTKYTTYRITFLTDDLTGSHRGLKAQFYGRAESTMIPLIPTMTSNTTPSGEVSANSAVSGYEAYKAFDGNDASTWWTTQNGYSAGAYLIYKFHNPTRATRAYIALPTQGTATFSLKVQGSENGTTWVDLTDAFTLSGSGSITLELSNVDEYEYYKILFVTATGNYAYIGVFQLYTDVDYTDNVLFRSAAQDDIYYLDNGSPVIIAHTDDYGYAIVDRDLLPEGENLTVYSTVAKNPTSLGNAYSRVIHFSKYLTEIYMRPMFNMLYWFGSICNDISGVSIEACNSANGWSEGGGCDFNTNDIVLYRSDASKIQGLSTSLLSSNYSTLKVVNTGVTITGSTYAQCGTTNTKTNNNVYNIGEYTTNGLNLKTFNLSGVSGKYLVIANNANNRNLKIHAIMLE